MFIRKKEITIKTGNGLKRYRYYYLVENYRENSRHRQRDILYLGKQPVLTKAKALKLAKYLRIVR